jgi:hypothetical protein
MCTCYVILSVPNTISSCHICRPPGLLDAGVISLAHNVEIIQYRANTCTNHYSLNYIWLTNRV